MTTLDFSDGLVENTFSFSNGYTYGSNASYGLYFSKNSQNYPFILKGGQSDDFELEYCTYPAQLRNRLLNTKKIKEVLNSAKIPLLFIIKGRRYLIGKGFLSTHDLGGKHQLLFIACVDGTKTITSIEQVKFYVSKMIYEEEHKAIQLAIKDLIGTHPGDVIMCKNILDYVGERLTFPKAVGLSELAKYKQAVIRTSLMEEFISGDPLIVESNHGTVAIHREGAAIDELLSGSADFTDAVAADVSAAIQSLQPTIDPGIWGSDVRTPVPSTVGRDTSGPFDPVDSTLPF